MQTCYRKITLNDDISRKNYIGCLIHYFMLSFVFVSVDSLQPMLFQQKFQIDKKDQIQNFKNAMVITFDIVVKLICAPIFGYLADKYGRQKINIYGIICISATMFLMPYAPTFWLYVTLRCIYATGAIAISVIPLLADYVSHQTRGTCAAFLVFMSSLGALASAYINFSILDQMDSKNKIYVQYGVISSIIVILGLSYSIICLKRGNLYYVRGAPQRKNFKEMLEVAKETFKSPEITSGYTAAFLARGDSILLSLYLVLWTYSFYDINDRSEDTYDQAFSKSSMLSGIAYTVIMLTCIIYGLLYGRKDISRAKVMISMLFLAMTGSFLINFATSPNSYMTYASLCVLGLGMSGLLTASLYLVNEYSTPEHRGFITGLQTFFGVLGIMLQTLIGAVLYEYVSRNGPFDYFSATCLVVLIVTIFVYRRSKQQIGANLLMDSEEMRRDSNISNENRSVHLV